MNVTLPYLALFLLAWVLLIAVFNILRDISR